MFKHSIGGGSSSASDNDNTAEDNKMATSVYAQTNPTPSSIMFDGSQSTHDGDTSGGAVGRHGLSISVLKQFLDPADIGTVEPLTAGANVTYDAGADMMTKSATGNLWNSWFQSTNVLIDPSTEQGMVSWLVEGDFDNDGDTGTQGTIREMGGLDDNPGANASYTSPEYSIYQVNATTVYVYERGSNKGAFSRPMVVGDRLAIKVIKGVVTYWHIRGNVETFIYQSVTEASAPLYFKGTLNRGTGQSGHASMGDIRTHKSMIPSMVSTHVTGAATEIIRDQDVDSLADIGLTVSAGSVYSKLIAEKITSLEFLNGRDYTTTHWYAVATNTSTETTT